MTEENEAVEREEGDQDAPEADEQEPQEGAAQPPASDPEAEREAAKWGWAPKDKWQGDPSQHRSAEDFLNDPRTQRRIREASDERFAQQDARHKEEMAAMRRATDLAHKRIAEIEKGGHENRVSDLQHRIEVAAEEGNLEEVRRLTGELTKAVPPAPSKTESDGERVNPEIQAWMDERPWTQDPALNLEAAGVLNRLIKAHPHMAPLERLGMVEGIMKGRYPEDFGVTNGSGQTRQERVQRVAGSEARGGGGGSDARSFSAIPAADRAIAKQHYIGEGKVFKTEKEYAKAYFDEHGVEQ